MLCMDLMGLLDIYQEVIMRARSCLMCNWIIWKVLKGFLFRLNLEALNYVQILYSQLLIMLITHRDHHGKLTVQSLLQFLFQTKEIGMTLQ